MSFQGFVEKHKGCSYSEGHARPNGGTITHQEEGKEYRYEYNPGETFLKIRVDGGLVRNDNESRCDFLLLNTSGMGTQQSNLHTIFIELKGTDIVKACQQLATTIKGFFAEMQPAKLHARIVVSKVAGDHNYPKMLQTYKTIFSKMNCSFHPPQTRQMVEYTGKDGHPTRK